MNEVDIAIILIVGASIYYGAARGVLIGCIDLVSIPLAIGIGSLLWKPAAAILNAFGLPSAMAGMLGFTFLSIGLAFGAIYGGLWLVRNLQPSKWIDRLGGGASGLLTGLMLAALLLMVSGIIPNALKPMERSAFGSHLVKLVPASYTALEQLGIALPKLVMLPPDYQDELRGIRRGPQFMQINFSRLGGATCMKCRTPTRFLGYKFWRGTLISPKFQCPNCGRTTDGCQTFEGFHRIYGRCPVDLANEGVRFDCGVWTNGDFILPKGPCPIDGKEVTPDFQVP
jgi:uncharacterized membrane protein required for colicin V production